MTDNKLFKSIIVFLFIFSMGFYYAASVASPSLLFTIMLVMGLGAVVGFLLALKLSEEKTGHLVVFAFMLAFTSAVVLELIIGKRLWTSTGLP